VSGIIQIADEACVVSGQKISIPAITGMGLIIAGADI
jgi:hypothetical protein